jgi:hypothetical protein
MRKAKGKTAFTLEIRTSRTVDPFSGATCFMGNREEVERAAMRINVPP